MFGYGEVLENVEKDPEGFNLIIFDLDGTLLDTALDLYLAFKDTLTDYGFEVPPFEEFKKHIGGGAYGFLQPFLPEELLEEALQRVRRYYLERYICVHTKPFEGIEETLQRLKKENLLLAVATNKITEGAVRVLKRTGLIDYFDLIVGRDLPPEHKPSPLHITYITKRLNVKPNKALVVGDRKDDVVAGNLAGAKTAYALWGYTEPLGEREEEKPHYRLEKPIQILDVVF